MKYCETNNYTLYQGEMQKELLNLKDNSIDSIITDPPYELGFMGKTWDNSGVAFQKETWEHCLRVLKPGGYLLAFGGSRTFHRIACAIEDAGFEIRDTIMWIYGSGFPKSMNLGLAIDKKNVVESEIKSQNEWSGWGTCLKPAFEPIIIARKPFNGSLIDNVLEYGVGGLNIDECRVPMSQNEPDSRVGTNSIMKTDGNKMWYGEGGYSGKDIKVYKDNGRFPANVILTYDDSDYDEVCDGFPYSRSGNNGEPYSYAGVEYNNKDTSMFNGDKPQAPSNYNDNGSASRYFYCAKASKKDRDEGLDRFEENKRKNIHPCVKPTTLIQYIIRLVSPKGSIILDPFMGSGSTGKATMIENVERNANYKFIGVEMTEEYLPIAKARIEFGCNYTSEIIENTNENNSVNDSTIATIKKESLW